MNIEMSQEEFEKHLTKVYQTTLNQFQALITKHTTYHDPDSEGVFIRGKATIENEGYGRLLNDVEVYSRQHFTLTPTKTGSEDVTFKGCLLKMYE